MAKVQVQHSYRRLPASCHQDCPPTAVSAPRYLAFNTQLATTLGLPENYHGTAEALELFSGNKVAEWMAPLAQAYAGHQFGRYVPRLGDGRAILLAELCDPAGKYWDLQLKGAGRTPYSRSGDGRSPIGPVIREYLISEAMFALGVPTTRALAAVSTGEMVYRDEPQPGAILTRVASSHIRIGTLQYAASQPDPAVLKALADYVIARHYPTLASHTNPYLALLSAVIAKQAALVAQWMSIGFIHGVMNTDNMLLSGETIDYGPCAFMENYNQDQVFSYIDQQGRYAYKNQPAIAQWNLARLAEALLSLIHPEQETAIALAVTELEGFTALYQQHWLQRFAAKIGIAQPQPDDKNLIDDFLHLLAQHQADFTCSFSDLAKDGQPYLQQRITKTALQPWLQRWQQRLAEQGEITAAFTLMQHVNPTLIPRNHLIQQVIEQVSQTGDLSLMHKLHQLWQQPFSDTAENQAFQQPATAHEQVTQTFCGT